MGLTPNKKHSDLCLEMMSPQCIVFLFVYLEKARVNVLICKKSRVSFAEIEIELCHTINFGVFDFVWNQVVPQQFTLEMFYSFFFF